MIRVQEKLEPASFNRLVRQPGNRWLALNRGRLVPGLKFPNYWKECTPDLRESYGGICAYTASYISTDIGNFIGSVDHFIPKSVAPDLAYEWSNYRFSSPRVNSNKDNSERVMDPFFIDDGWFQIDFNSFLIRPEQSLHAILKQRVDETIIDLRLNIDDHLVQGRAQIVSLYIEGAINMLLLDKRYPFIAMELRRQGLVDRIKERTRRTV